MVVGARILYDILHGRLAWRNYVDIDYYFGKGLWGGPLAYLGLATVGILLFGRNKRSLLDVMVLALPVPMILAKLACFYNGCCYGTESTLPWAVAFPEGAEAPADVFRHPTQLYEMVVLVVILLTFQIVDRDRWRGGLVFWFVGLYGLGRPLTEFFRASEERVPRVGSLTDSQVVCLGAAAVAVLALLVWRWRTVRRSTGSPAS
jgi:phosphatidylglycerol:prolipoprotein diacylglycerol transferase